MLAKKFSHNFTYYNNNNMKYLIALALLVSSSNAFAPVTTRQTIVSAEQSATAIGPGFLKDLGFEKPSWLPDFGKKEEEAAAAAPAVDAEASDEEGEETAAEDAPAEDDAP